MRGSSSPGNNPTVTCVQYLDNIQMCLSNMYLHIIIMQMNCRIDFLQIFLRYYKVYNPPINTSTYFPFHWHYDVKIELKWKGRSPFLTPIMFIIIELGYYSIILRKVVILNVVHKACISVLLPIHNILCLKISFLFRVGTEGRSRY